MFNLDWFILQKCIKNMSCVAEHGAWLAVLLTDLFETSQVFLSWSEDVYVVFGLFLHYFSNQLLPLFRLSFFQVRLSLPCGCNSSYSFPPIILKLCILILHGL